MEKLKIYLESLPLRILKDLLKQYKWEHNNKFKDHSCNIKLLNEIINEKLIDN